MGAIQCLQWISDKILMKFVDVLYVDDNKLNRFIVEKQLREHFSVEVLSSGEELYKVLESSIPKVLILDWMMPSLSGYDVLKDLRSNPRYKSLIIIMLTARASKDDMIRCLSEGANDYIVKPPHYPEMIARIKTLLRQRRAEDQMGLQNQLQSYETLLKGMTHEFNNIFSALRLALQMYEVKGPDYFNPKVDELKSFIQRGIDLIHHLRGFRNTVSLDASKIDLKESLIQAIRDFNQSRDFEKSPIKLKNLAENCFVQGSPEQLAQVYDNILSNASHAITGKNGGKIQVELHEFEGSYRITFEDNGIGIEPEALRELGNIFYTTKGSFGDDDSGSSRVGTGLGLPTCKRILAAHNANLEIQSVLGDGTLVSIEFVKEAHDKG